MLHEKQSSGNCQKETIHGVTKEFEKQPRLQNFKLNVTLTCSIICTKLIILLPSSCTRFHLFTWKKMSFSTLSQILNSQSFKVVSESLKCIIGMTFCWSWLLLPLLAFCWLYQLYESIIIFKSMVILIVFRKLFSHHLVSTAWQRVSPGTASKIP